MQKWLQFIHTCVHTFELVKWSLRASHEENIDITLKEEFDHVPEYANIIKQDDFIDKNVDNIWQKAICTRQHIFNLAMLTENGH